MKIPAKYYRIAEKTGIARRTFETRVNKGMDIETACTKPSMKKPIFTLEELKIAENNGISLRTARERYYYGWSKEECITRPIDTRKGNRK